MLSIAVVVLASYNLRKKLPVLPLGSSAAWLQFHIYVGLLSFLVFAAHTHGRLPRGPLDVLLACVYLGTAGSGVIGLVLTRVLPSQITSMGEEVLFERIPKFRRELRLRAEQLVLQSAAEAEASALADLYTRRLAAFFAGPRNFRHHLISSVRPRCALMAELADVDRYLSPGEKQIALDLRDLIEAKNDLDRQYALQATLKCWLFVHLPLTYSLLLVAGMHAVLVHAFQGGPA